MEKLIFTLPRQQHQRTGVTRLLSPTEKLTVLLVVLSFVVSPMVLRGTPAAAASGRIAVEDANGRTVSVPTPVLRVVTLNKNAAEILRILGVQDRIVGISRWLDRTRAFWPELNHAVYVGTFNDPDLEVVAPLRPDLILAYGHTPGEELEEKMRPFGACVLRLDLHHYDTFRRDVESLGRIFGRQERAREYLDWESDRVERILACARSDAHRPRVYLESYGEFYGLGPGSSGHERCELANGENIGGELGVMRALVTPEWVLAHDPEVVIKSGSLPGSYDEGSLTALEQAREEMLHRPGLRDTTAARQGRVHVINADIYTGPRTVISLAYMARWLHPDTCADIDPEALHRDYLERFQGMPYREGSATPVDEGTAPAGGGFSRMEGERQ